MWLVSVDLWKCYDMIRWWAIFGAMLWSGVPGNVVAVFRDFYRKLRRHFRYGQVDGEEWQAENGLPQGCSAAPDLLNMLMESFHRWAGAQGVGVVVGERRVASVGFADDLTLVARSRDEVVFLVRGYRRWCALLDLEVTKVHAWCNLGVGEVVEVGGLTLKTEAYLKVVGVVLGEGEGMLVKEHFTPRLQAAAAVVQRLRTLDLPASVCCLLWRTDVLPKALYGCEVRDVTPKDLVPLSSAGKAAIGPKHPLGLNVWRAPEVLMGPPFGDSSVRDPVLEARERQLRWLQLVCNMPGLVGEVHRLVAWDGDAWVEPNRAFRSALRAVSQSCADCSSMSWER